MSHGHGLQQRASARSWQRRVLPAIAGLAFVSAVLGISAAAFAGGEGGHVPPSAGPPAPWNDREVGEGEDVRYRRTDARSCRLGATRRAGPGSVLGVWVVGTRCRIGKRVVRRYQRCLNRADGRRG